MHNIPRELDYCANFADWRGISRRKLGLAEDHANGPTVDASICGALEVGT
jgi:hypothetical protein